MRAPARRAMLRVLHFPTVALLTFFVATLTLAQELSKPQDLQLQPFLPPSYHIRENIISSLSQLEEEFVTFMSAIPRLWTKPRPVRHYPIEWREPHSTREARSVQTSGPCNSPFGYSVQKVIDPCGPLHDCYIEELKCNGSIADTSKVSVQEAQQNNCSVHKIQCRNASNPIPHIPTEGCSLIMAECPPRSNLSYCTLREVICEHKLLQFPPIGSPGCFNTTPQGLPCIDACSNMTTDQTVCVCSLDRMGHTCNEWRPYICNVTLASPEPQCQSSILDSDPICFLYSRKQKVDFTYRLHCSFTNTSNLQESILYDSLFDYWARRKDEFAISAAQQQQFTMLGELCAYDFNRLGNRDGCTSVPLTPEQCASDEPFSFTLDFAQLRDNFFAGDRLYFEVGFNKNSSFSGRSAKKDRRFVDFTDLKIARSLDDSLSQITISWIIVGCVCGAACLLCALCTAKRKFQQYKLNQRIKKLE